MPKSTARRRRACKTDPFCARHESLFPTLRFARICLVSLLGFKMCHVKLTREAVSWSLDLKSSRKDVSPITPSRCREDLERPFASSLCPGLAVLLDSRRSRRWNRSWKEPWLRCVRTEAKEVHTWCRAIPRRARRLVSWGPVLCSTGVLTGSFRESGRAKSRG